jgi:1-acyl-sn-glycerol-3-phosphate acyltransferase
VICVNHQSQVDILALSNLHGSWRWVSKVEIFRIPFLGWAMKSIGTPGVKRGDKASGQKMLEQCRVWLDRGVSILMFPEGTRSDDGSLLPFKPGAFKLALETGRPVLPIALDGTRFCLPKHSGDASGRGRAIVSVLEPIDVGPWREKQDVDGLALATRTAIETELARIRSQP